MVVKSSLERVLILVLLVPLREVDVDAKHVGREVRLHPVAHAGLPGGLPHAAVCLEELIPALAGDGGELLLERVALRYDLPEEVLGPVRGDVALGLRKEQGFGGLAA